MALPLLITNGKLVTWDEELVEDGALYLAEGKIADVGRAPTLPRNIPTPKLSTRAGS